MPNNTITPDLKNEIDDSMEDGESTELCQNAIVRDGKRHQDSL